MKEIRCQRAAVVETHGGFEAFNEYFIKVKPHIESRNRRPTSLTRSSRETLTVKTAGN
jgi:hypothetical protein